MNKIVAFVGETFELHEDMACTSPTSVAFIQDLFGKENVFVCSPISETKAIYGVYNTTVPISQFYPSPKYRSIKEFILKAIFKPGYYKEFNQIADDVIEKHRGDLFWIRTPSIGSIYFGLRALSSGEIVLNHICGDVSSSWRDDRYSLIEKIFGFFISKYLVYKLQKICRHPNSINLCTGDILEAFSKRLAPDRTYQFVDVMTSNCSVESRLRDPTGALKVLFVGRVIANKGIFDLIDVGSKLGKKCQITIAGGGPDLDSAKKYTKLNKLDNIINYTGFLSHDKLNALYEEHDVVVVPSKCSEGFPRVIMEAWLHYRPVVVSNIGGINAFVENNVNGLIFEPGNKDELYNCLVSIIDDYSLYSKLQNGAVVMASQSHQQHWLDAVKFIINKHGVNK